jgi:hypothetical protein
VEVRGKRAKAIRRLVYGASRDGKKAARGHRKLVMGSNGGFVTKDWQRREYQGLKRGYVGPNLKARWQGLNEAAKERITSSTGVPT